MPNSSSKRLFIAIPLDQIMRDDIADVMQSLDVPGMWKTSPKNMHLTIKFLGGVEDSFINQVTDALEMATEDFTPFDLNVTDFLWLPNDRRPRVLSVELNLPDQLSRLVENIEQATNAIGFPLEGRAFRPHITVARFKTLPRPPLPELVAPQTGFTAGQVLLIESILQPTGPIYTPLAQYPPAPGSPPEVR